MKRILVVLLVAVMAVGLVMAEETGDLTVAPEVEAAENPAESAAAEATNDSEPVKDVEAVSVRLSRFTIGARAGYGSISYSYRNRDTKVGEHSGFSGFPIDIEFCYRFGQSRFGAMAVMGLSLGRSYYDDTKADGEVNKTMSAFGKVLFDSFFSVYGEFTLNQTFDLRLALGPAIKVYEVKQPGIAGFPAFLMGLKLEGALRYDLTSFLFIDAGLGLEVGLVNGATGKSTEEIRKSAFTFGWNLFLGAGIAF